MGSVITSKIASGAVLLLAAAVAACGGSTQASTGTTPSVVSPVSAASDAAGTFGLFKEGKGKGTPTDGTTPDPDEDAGDIGEGHGHGNAAIQLEGLVGTNDIDGTCKTIVINHITVTTVDATEFQRATCKEIVDATATGPVRLHIAAKMQEDLLVASYVRMQGPKGDDGDDAAPATSTP